VTIRDINDIEEDWKRYEKWTIDGTGWDEDGNPNASDSVQPAKEWDLSPWPIDCQGCGEAGDGYEGSDKETIECDICKKWSHIECLADFLELSMDNDDGTWSCPVCRGIVVWTGDK
jgi:hypothetical protein